MYEFLRFTILWMYKWWCVFCIAQTTFLNLDSYTKVCSQLMVLYVGCSSLMISGLCICLHRESLWFRMCRVSMIFLMSCHIYLRSPAWVENYVIMHSIFWGICTCNVYLAGEVVVLLLSGCPNDTCYHTTKWSFASLSWTVSRMQLSTMLGLARTPGPDLQIYANKKEIEDPVYTYRQDTWSMTHVPNDMYLQI